ncbi:MAG: phosphonate C-P lyase system protein PhnG [Desulfonatronovibrio sp.]
MPEKFQGMKTISSDFSHCDPDLQHEPALILEYAPADQCQELASDLKKSGFEVQWVRKGMIMQKIRDSFDVCFNLGEVLASEAMARHKETIGYGVMLGDSQDGSFILACLDAAQKVRDQELQKFILNRLRKLEPELIKALQEQKDMTKSTRVNFGLMVEG